jgi:hypothetical protein
MHAEERDAQAQHHPMCQLIHVLNPFLFINKTIYYILRGFLLPWKKRRDMFSEGNAAHRVGYDSMLSDSNDSLSHVFFLILTYWVGCVSLLLSIMARFKLKKTAITICSGLSHPTRSLSRIVCREKEHP